MNERTVTTPLGGYGQVYQEVHLTGHHRQRAIQRSGHLFWLVSRYSFGWRPPVCPASMLAHNSAPTISVSAEKREYSVAFYISYGVTNCRSTTDFVGLAGISQHSSPSTDASSAMTLVIRYCLCIVLSFILIYHNGEKGEPQKKRIPLRNPLNRCICGKLLYFFYAFKQLLGLLRIGWFASLYDAFQQWNGFLPLSEFEVTD